MDLEMLRQIMDVINCLGADAKDAFIWYMVAWVAVTVFSYAIPCALGTVLLGAIVRIVESCTRHEKWVKWFENGQTGTFVP